MVILAGGWLLMTTLRAMKIKGFTVPEFDFLFENE
jgi:hypothetical protein